MGHTHRISVIHHAQIPVCPSLVGGWVGLKCRFAPYLRGVWTSGCLGIPRCRFAPYLRGVLEKRVFGYTQLPTQIDFHIPTQAEFVRVGTWVYPATHVNQIPYTHTGRICASGYFGIPSYPLDIHSYPLISNSEYSLRSKYGANSP